MGKGTGVGWSINSSGCNRLWIRTRSGRVVQTGVGGRDCYDITLVGSETPRDDEVRQGLGQCFVAVMLTVSASPTPPH